MLMPNKLDPPPSKSQLRPSIAPSDNFAVCIHPHLVLYIILSSIYIYITKMSQLTHRTTQATTQPSSTQRATQRTDAPATNVSNPPTNRRTGRQQGSQGYSGNDCLALVNFVKHVQPLGSNDWEHVHELYNQYALEAGRSTRDADPLKTKFRAMVSSRKPTGDPDCPVWIREAKRANMMIKDRAHSIAFVDEDNGEMGSDD
ncbi:hypothetical protein PGT21_013962 [Puccinia graminis f. sp. tritici]|uniref:DUF6818 domain-containing protein n=1 Tax=Puccinia graminis f. sp. tritici TaxID=56615 RepID=A0A5B0QT36_PUCGR|nr:hypothetical protein PGT21_013962 [Puccinia graminis f. sp. tritici]